MIETYTVARPGTMMTAGSVYNSAVEIPKSYNLSFTRLMRVILGCVTLEQLGAAMRYKVLFYAHCRELKRPWTDALIRRVDREYDRRYEKLIKQHTEV
jgi:hypothetical protein